MGEKVWCLVAEGDYVRIKVSLCYCQKLKWKPSQNDISINDVCGGNQMYVHPHICSIFRFCWKFVVFVLNGLCLLCF